MATFLTPRATRTKAKTSENNENATTPVKIPLTPYMTRLGYGTCVSVYSMARSSKPGNENRSPWAVKKVTRGAPNMQVTKIYENRIKAEAEILKSINHPNIVGFRALTETTDGRKCLAMEECQESLCDLVEERHDHQLGPFPVNKIVKVGLDVASALDYLHRTTHLLHGDIKSSNILIKDDFKFIKLCDFGVSIWLDDDGVMKKSKNRSKAQSYIGTPCWNAPEVQYDNGLVTTKADIFAFGLVIWEMLALQPPHMNASLDDGSDASFDEDAFDQRLGTRPPLPPLSSKYDAIVKVFEACTEQDMDQRPTAEMLVKTFQSMTAIEKTNKK